MTETNQTKVTKSTQVLDSLDIAIARVRSHLDKWGMNEETKKTIEDIKSELHKVMKEGGDENDKEYVSEKYKKAEETFNVYKNKQKQLATFDAELKRTQTKLDKSPTDETLKQKVQELENNLNNLTKETDVLTGDNLVKKFVEKAQVKNTEVRFKKDSPVALAVILQKMVEELMEHSMQATIAAKKKMVYPAHYLSEGHEQLSFYSLVKNLPSYQRYVQYLKDKEVYDQTIKQLKKQAKAEAKKSKKEHREVFDNMEKPNEPQYVRLQATKEGETKKMTFCHYIGKIFTRFKTEDPDQYQELRLSSDIKDLFSDFVMEFIRRIEPLLKIFLNATSVKTVGPETVKHVVEFILIDGGQPNDDLFKTVDEKVAEYNVLVGKDKEKNEEAPLEIATN